MFMEANEEADGGTVFTASLLPGTVQAILGLSIGY